MSNATKRRPTIDRRSREFLADTVLPFYLSNIDKNVSTMEKVAADGGNPFITADAAESMALHFRQQRERALDVASLLGADIDDGDDDA